MTQHSSEQPPEEYIIDTDMLATWRSGCIQWRNKNPDTQCYGCTFDGKGFRKGCCNFDDDAMQAIFQSRPHPAPAQQRIDAAIKELKEAKNHGLVLMEDHIDRAIVLLQAGDP